MSQTPKQIIQTDPSLKDVLDAYGFNLMLQFNCHAIAQVQSFDSSKQTVQAKVMYKKTFVTQDRVTKAYSESYEDYAVLMDCPVIIISGGNASLTMPIQQGDTCLILFNDRDLDNWFASGQIQPVATSRLHSFSDGIALVGLRALNASIQNYDSTRAVLQYGQTMVGVSSSKVKITNSAGNSLNSLLQNLISTIAGLTTTPCVVGSPATLAPTVITQLNQIGTQLGDLLE
jgi:hypothetical protein